MRNLAGLTLLAILALAPAASADPIPSERRVDWSFTGVPGGIPNRTTICATFSPGATAAAINAAIGACNNGVVMLNAGTYSAASLGGGINVNKSNVTLRGAGADKTIITGSGQLAMSSSGNTSQALGTAITSGGTKGSTSFVVASVANLSVGAMIEIDRADDPNIIPPGSFNSWSPSNGRSMVQVDVITAISGSTVTVRNPLLFDYTTFAPKIKAFYPNVISKIGIENLKVDLQGGTSGAALEITTCDSCWVKGVSVGNGGNYIILVDSSVNLEIRDTLIHDGGTGPNHAGISFQSDYRYWCSSSAKVENNIINKAFPNVEINNCSSGLYIGYNYSPGSNGGAANVVTFNLDDAHAPFPFMDLFEGNLADQMGTDGFYGGAGYGTALRNYFTGYNPNAGQPKGDAIAFRRLAYDYNVVGNVLGSTLQGPAGYIGCQLYNNIGFIYSTPGLPNIGSCDTVNGTPDSYTPPGGYPDAKVAATMLRWGNYDYFNAMARFDSTEIPSGVPVPSDHVIPASYAYASQPSWWTSSIPWPPIGPDVTGGNGDTSGHVNKLPAQVCAETQNLLTGGAFNAATCFQSAGQGIPSITSAVTASGTVNSPFSYTITATNNPTSFNATGLPAGLSVNTTTGVISGTPTAAGTSSVRLSAANATGSCTAALTLTIAAVNTPVVTSSLSANATVGVPFSYTITATNSPTSFGAAVLPPGLSINTTTGAISGTPTANGMSNVTLSATNASGTGSATLALSINSAAPSITSTLTATGTMWIPFNYTITATNNPTSFNATGLPAGLSVNTTTGAISGTPTTAVTSSVALSATNASGTGTATLALTINGATAGNSIFLASDVPAVVNFNDPSPVELGVKFTATRAGNITALRFYKGPQNTGTHTAHLWNKTGTLLAYATFAGETASGWQQVNLPSPVAITANTTYIVSYHTDGFYSANSNYFAKAHTSGPLTAPSSASSGGNGVYAYDWQGSFPSNTYNANNYWVDVVFQ